MELYDKYENTSGKFANYTTLLGGKPVHTEDVGGDYPEHIWSRKDFTSSAIIDGITSLSGSVSYNEDSQTITASGNYGSEKKFIFSSPDYFLDCASIIGFTTPASSTDSGFSIGSILRYDSATLKHLYCGIEKTTIDGSTKQFLVIRSFNGSAYSSPIASMALDANSLVNSKEYWLVSIVVGNKIRGELWTQDPSDLNANRASVVSGTFSGFGYRGEIGVANWVPKASSANIFYFEAGYAFASTKLGNFPVASRNQHVDIRTMLNETRIAPRAAASFDRYHQTEKAYSQSLSLKTDPVEGVFQLLFYQSDNAYSIPKVSNPISFDASAESIKAEIIDLVSSSYKHSYFNGDSIVSVTRPETGSCFPLVVEFNHFYGDLSLLRIALGGLRNSLGQVPESTVYYEPTDKSATFSPNRQDSFFIETADPLDPEYTQKSMQQLEDHVTENWKLYSANGAFAPATYGGSSGTTHNFIDSDLFVGKHSEFENMRVGRVQLYPGEGNKWSFSLQSSTPRKATNAKLYSDLTKASINVSFLGVEDIAAIDLSFSYIQFTSNANGLFYDQGGESLDDSNKVGLQGNMITGLNGRCDFRSTMKLFENTNANARFDFGQITGVRIVLLSGSAMAPSFICVGGVRAIDTSVVYLPLASEINTRTTNVAKPIPLADKSLEELSPLILGVEFEPSDADEFPIGGEVQMIVETAEVTTEQTEFNKIQLYTRHITSDAATDWAEWLTTEFGFNNNDIYIKSCKTFRRSSAGGQYGDLYWDIHPGGIFTNVRTSVNPDIISSLDNVSPNSIYQFASTIESNSITHMVDSFNTFGQPIRRLFESTTYTSAEWAEKSGRIGWHVSLIDDTQLRSFDFAPSTYALLRTKTVYTDTPVDGAQLFTVDSGDKNVFEYVKPSNPEDFVEVDSTKSLSGASYKISPAGKSFFPGFLSNQFSVSNWGHFYVKFDIWVPSEIQEDSYRPRFYLRPIDSAIEGSLGKEWLNGDLGPISFSFVPNSWSSVFIPLSSFNTYQIGQYKMLIASDNPHNKSFWIDNVEIRKKTVEWEIRAKKNGAWHPFRDTINQQYSAIHFSSNQMGTEIQLQARALTEDAWISEYTLRPRYAHLGRILYATAIENLVTGKAKIGTSELANALAARTESSENALGEQLFNILPVS